MAATRALLDAGITCNFYAHSSSFQHLQNRFYFGFASESLFQIAFCIINKNIGYARTYKILPKIAL